MRTAGVVYAGLVAALIVLGGACASARGVPRAQLESEIVIEPREEQPLLSRLPYDQGYAWVEPSRLLRGTVPREDSVRGRLVDELRQSIRLPLEAAGWHEVPIEDARYLVTVLLAERTVLVDDPTHWRDYANLMQGQQRKIPAGRTFRAFVIAGRGGGLYWELSTSDRWTVEAQFGARIVNLLLDREP